MQCPNCGSQSSRVLDSRYKPDINQKRRRRQCNDCDTSFTTFESVASSQGKMPRVVKRDGRREAFDPDKIRKGLLLAIAKRPVSTEKMDALVEKVAKELAKTGAKEVAAERIGMMVMRELLQADHVAYIRFASVYRNFKDAGAFRDEATEVSAAARSGAADGQRDFFDEELPGGDGRRDGED